MAKKTATKPTQSEVEILGILWDHGPSTVRGETECGAPRERTAVPPAPGLWYH